jgi:tetratricopeptide (TPR) repeat protein
MPNTQPPSKTAKPARPESTPASSVPWPLQLLREANPLALCVLLVALVAGTYFPSLHNGFVSLDDQAYVSANSHVQHGLTWSGFRWSLTAVEASMWHPVTWLSLMLDTTLLGTAPFDYHLTNLLLHTANTVLLFLLLLRLTGAAWRSAFVAALFGVHPLHVESVAWIAERKDVLSTLFFLLTLWAYVRYAEERGGGVLEWWSIGKGKSEIQPSITPKLQSPAAPAPQHSSTPALHGAAAARFYALAFGFFALGLLSKPMLVTIPFVLLLLDYWPLGRLAAANPKSEIQHSNTPILRSSPTPTLQLLWEKLPFFALSLACGVVTMFAQRGAGSFMTATELPVHHRLDNALLTCVHYLVQTFWPGRYAFYYPYPRGFSVVAVLLAVLILLLISGAALWNLRARPYVAFGWAWYLITLLPVIGLIQVGNQAQADRYTYIPLIGIFVLLAWAGTDFVRSRFAVPSSRVCLVAGCLAIGVCVPFTRQQISYWHDGGSLAAHALEVTRDNPVALNMYGVALSKHGQLDDAILCWQQAVQIAPRYAHAQGNLGAALLRKGLLDDSIQHSREAIRLKPNLPGAYSNLGAALGSKGRLDEAITAFKEAVRLAPQDPQTRYNLGYAYEGKGHYDEAIAQYEEALRLAPENQAVRQRLQQVLAAKARRK